jgi:thiol-disulfide isomerase/thioredoxin
MKVNQSRPAPNGSPKKAIAAVVVVLIVIVAVVVAFFLAGKSKSTASNSFSNGIEGPPVPEPVFYAVTHVPATVLDQLGLNTKVALKPQPILSNTSKVLTANGKPEVLYIGANYCPFCAAERWPVIVALSRFGSFSNLHLMESSATDVYPSTNTFTFYHSSYSSPYITFKPVEIETRYYKKLEPLTSGEQQLLNLYDAPPYVPSSDQGAIPFIDFGNQFVINGATYSPQVLSGLNWQTIAASLSHPQTPPAQGIDESANGITAAICRIDNQQPGSVCDSPTIRSIEHTL